MKLYKPKWSEALKEQFIKCLQKVPIPLALGNIITFRKQGEAIQMKNDNIEAKKPKKNQKKDLFNFFG